MIHIIGGGTFSHVRNHLALAAPAFGTTAKAIYENFYKSPQWRRGETSPKLHLTKMASSASTLVTNQDVSDLLDKLIADPSTSVIYLNAALCDFDGSILNESQPSPSGKYASRLKTRSGEQTMRLTPAPKLIGKIRKTRKDIFVVGFKTTAGDSPDEQYVQALNMLKENSVNLVLANDTITRHNMIVAPEETRYHETTDRDEVLRHLYEMVTFRSQNHFTRSTVIEGDIVPWNSEIIPDNLREVVNHCVARGAYKSFRGVTAGHFAVKINEGSCLTSVRKTNYNDLQKGGLVRVDYDGRDKVIAHGAKPSVGGQSQRIVFQEHPDLDCIVHAHIEMRDDAPDKEKIGFASQFQNQCGSTECGSSTSRNLLPVGDDIHAVMLDNHGPNIVFSRNTPAEKVINFIETNFDLESKTGGLLI